MTIESRALIDPDPPDRTTMFKIFELKNTASASATEVGQRYSTRQEALAAVKKHLKTFKVSGHNAEKTIGGYGTPKGCVNAGFPHTPIEAAP
jgi:hypothetical protein